MASEKQKSHWYRNFSPPVGAISKAYFGGTCYQYPYFDCIFFLLSCTLVIFKMMKYLVSLPEKKMQAVKIVMKSKFPGGT